MSKQTTDIKGRAMGRHYLENQDVEILEQQYRCEAGKADFIIKEDNEIVIE
jgi:Holliday junction resolvase-like predicted endonuclease